MFLSANYVYGETWTRRGDIANTRSTDVHFASIVDVYDILNASYLACSLFDMLTCVCQRNPSFVILDLLLSSLQVTSSQILAHIVQYWTPLPIQKITRHTTNHWTS